MTHSQLILSRHALDVDPVLRRKAFAFLVKITEDDSLPGLHVEPIRNSADPRVRTGRVDQQFRAVLFKLDTTGEPTYVVHGIYNHDQAIEVAQSAVLERNPINGIVEVRQADVPLRQPAPMSTGPVPVASAVPSAAESAPPAPPAPETPVTPVLTVGVDQLVHELGMSPAVAEQAVQATSERELLAVAETQSDWQVDALLALNEGMSVAEVRQMLDMETLDSSTPVTDDDLAGALDKPAARMTFARIKGADELQRVIDSGDFGAWRVFLHPEQTRFATGDWGGAFRLTGGAGTGKTVVVLHRTRHLSQQNPTARIIVTTFTRNLADALDRDLQRLDPGVPRASRPGDAGVCISGIDSLALGLVRRAGDDIASAAEAVLGTSRAQLRVHYEDAERWRAAIATAGAPLRDDLRTPHFFMTEYSLVILPAHLTTQEAYLRARRPGRGIRLSRSDRSAIWSVVSTYREASRNDGVIDGGEMATIAASWLDSRAGSGLGRLADHVLVDEGQDLSPAHWLLVRALAEPGRNDIFIAEDSHQRIYGHRVVLSRFGMQTRGRSRRLTLNYRTTAENLAWAVQVLEGGDYVDLDETPDTVRSYRSARSGPAPVLRGFANLSAELDFAAHTLNEWLTPSADGLVTPPETLAILVRDRPQRDRLVAGLQERGVEVRAVDRDAVRPGKPVVMTMHRAKGTEFTKVLLFEVSARSIPMSLRDFDYDDEEKADALLRERSLLYVAASRARDELVATWSSQASPLLAAPPVTT